MAMEPVPLGFGDFSITMDASLSSLWPLQDLHYHPQQSVEEVKQRLAAAMVELEAAREEVRHKEQSIAGLMELAGRTAEERDQLQRQQQLLLVTSSGDADRSPVVVFEPTPDSSAAVLELLATKRPLPQQGRLLQAVIEAGPLLQNLMVAGPLPRWRNPPPAQALPSTSTSAIISSPSYFCAPPPMGLPWSID